MLRLLTLCLAIAHCSAVRIAFIGNSYTYYNDLPNMVKELAANSDTPIEIAYAHELVGGSCLSNTCNGEVHQNRSATEVCVDDYLPFGAPAGRYIRPAHRKYMLGLFAFGGCQGAIGWLMVKSGPPDISALYIGMLCCKGRRWLAHGQERSARCGSYR